MVTEWGLVDLVAVVFGVLSLLVGLIFDQKKRNIPSAIALIANGLALGPLLLLVIDPFIILAAMVIEFKHYNLLELVLKEGRAPMWWGTTIASAYISRDIIK